MESTKHLKNQILNKMGKTDLILPFGIPGYFWYKMIHILYLKIRLKHYLAYREQKTLVNDINFPGLSYLLRLRCSRCSQAQRK